jgi:filamentous hemagglutinin
MAALSSQYNSTFTKQWQDIAFTGVVAASAMYNHLQSSALTAAAQIQFKAASSEFLIAESGTTKVFRVEGPGNARVAIGADGSVSISGDKTLFLNFGDEARANAFYQQRLVNPNTPGAQIKSFDVPNSYIDQLRAQAVPESMASQFPGRPIQVDITKTASSYGLRPDQVAGLTCVIVPGSGKVVC